VIKQIKIKYKQSILGIAWAIILPFGMMMVFTIVFSNFAKIPSEGIPYPIFSYSALLPWTFFATSLNFGIKSLVSNYTLVQQIYFPRELLPASSVAASFFDFIIGFIIFIGMIFFYEIHLTLYCFWLLPIIFLQIIFTVSVCLLFSALNIFYRDVGYALTFFIQLWMYACPIIYPISSVPDKFKLYYCLNPMAGIIDSIRKVVVHGSPPNEQYLFISLLVTIITFFFSYKLFKKLEMKFADII